ncbi:MAG: hypothetical protein IJE84_03765 [Clostridia bacterium]|nr:hypothetical protein [Clostridia bacterium]
MTKKEKQQERLRAWQEKFDTALAAYSEELSKMDRREALYRGSDVIEPMFSGEGRARTPLLRNVIAENIESCIDPSIPTPKVTAKRQEDAHLAAMIEDMLYGELERLCADELNDLDERLCPIHGSSFFHVEWDGERGCVALSVLGARMVIPQPAVCGSVEDMEYYFLRIPRTKEHIRRTYGVDVGEETERYPDVRGEGAVSDVEMVSQIYAYYKNDRGSIGLLSWVGDTVLVDDEDYSIPKHSVCSGCGSVVTEGEHCASCGGVGERRAATHFDFYTPVEIGGQIYEPSYDETAGILDGQGENGMAATVPEPVRVPVYDGVGFGLVMRKNVSRYGAFLGESDVDKMQTQQNVLNRLALKMLKKNLGGGTVLSLPDDADITVEETEGGSLRIIRPRDAASASLIRTFTLEGDISADFALYNEAYEEARQLIGVTDSLQGRRDNTATSGTAKRFAAAQSQGRLESKRIMKKAAWSRIYELIFRLKLAYSSPDTLPVRSDTGEVRYADFDRLAFVYRGDDGLFRYNDAFIFSCDDAAPLGRDRSAMWSEAAANFARGAYGDPASREALILLWQVLESFNYPSAGMVREAIERQGGGGAVASVPRIDIREEVSV